LWRRRGPDGHIGPGSDGSPRGYDGTCADKRPGGPCRYGSACAYAGTATDEHPGSSFQW